MPCTYEHDARMGLTALAYDHRPKIVATVCCRPVGLYAPVIALARAVGVAAATPACHAPPLCLSSPCGPAAYQSRPRRRPPSSDYDCSHTPTAPPIRTRVARTPTAAAIARFITMLSKGALSARPTWLGLLQCAPAPRHPKQYVFWTWGSVHGTLS